MVVDVPKSDGKVSCYLLKAPNTEGIEQINPEIECCGIIDGDWAVVPHQGYLLRQCGSIGIRDTRCGMLHSCWCAS